ncbi:hypothetical protein [Lysinibacillus fusiformis]|uniref:hypothetical protein n=1 Tax=Lysinibacillus fusiformis TaxID=28031 RepID=UPI000D33932C|nr:hypothetical protein [Lysinibacillus fusiformis]MED4672378.1 hypothetical protein [Lysinibacillus fusiformis]RDV32227.1 hypothetical protein C7B90_10910 [Lysinibacillus fusiformis]GED65581.1 hypothetical protein LFU01_40330 [Lysinibacillus fusiformis]
MKLLSFAEANYITMLDEMGHSEYEIKKRMKKRIRLTVFMFVIFLILSILTKNSLWYLLLVFMSFVAFKNDYNKVNRLYDEFCFKRELQFSKFMRLIVPYLKQSADEKNNLGSQHSQRDMPLYTIFTKLIPRLDGDLQKSLFRLMNEMVAAPNDITPFLEFSKRSSNKDIDLNFMMAIFDYQNSTKELSVIEELSDIANRELLKRTKEVINLKFKKVNSIPFMLAISIVLILIPYLLAFIIYSVKTTGLV